MLKCLTLLLFHINAMLKSCFARLIARYERERQGIFENVLGFSYIGLQTFPTVKAKPGE